MFKKIILYLLLIVTLTNANAQQFVQPTLGEKLIIERFEYLKQIKNYIGNIFWKNFASEEFHGTIVYFSDSASYFINPKPEMKDKVSRFTVMENDYNWNIWKLRFPLDSAKYVMETQFQFHPKTKKYINYRIPVLFCSSPEITKKEKLEMNTTQEWSIAMIHEMYNQYQYSNEAVLTYVLRLFQEDKMIDMDSLQGIYLSNKSFYDTLQIENDLLKRAVASSSLEEEKKLFTQFLKLRAKRNLEYFKKKKFYVNTPENFWEKMEGTCMMMERILKQNFDKVKPTEYIETNDPMFSKTFTYNDHKTNDVNFYSDLKDNRFYVGTTGFNMIQLLEKNKVPYKDNFFSYASLPLDLQLKYFYKIK